MAEGQSVTHKLTKRPQDMREIEDLPGLGPSALRHLAAEFWWSQVC